MNEQSTRQFRFDLVDEQVDTATRAVLATTAACARCHDHKFDPIPMSDYYALAGIFLSSETYFGTPSGVQNRHATDLIELPVPDPEPVIDPLTPAESSSGSTVSWNSSRKSSDPQPKPGERATPMKPNASPSLPFA